jgi:hypothetical protein
MRRGGPSTGAIKEDSQIMSFDISSVQGLHAATGSVGASGKAAGAKNGRRVDNSDAVKVDVSGIPHSPPSEVLDAMGVAAAQHDALAASGRGLSFKIDDATGKVVVSVHDNHGNVMFTVPGSKALDFASGGSLE